MGLTKSPCKPTGRKLGGQEGHKGRALKKVVTPDETEEVSPNYCTKCGSLLEDSESILDYVTQVVLIPKLKPLGREIRLCITVCRKYSKRIKSHLPACMAPTRAYTMRASKVSSCISIPSCSSYTAA